MNAHAPEAGRIGRVSDARTATLIFARAQAPPRTGSV